MLSVTQQLCRVLYDLARSAPACRESVSERKELSTMGIPYRARVNERWFLNLPGFHGGAYVVAYFEDTSDCEPRSEPYCEDDCPDCPHNFEPKMILEIADCYKRVNPDFDLDLEECAR